MFLFSIFLPLFLLGLWCWYSNRKFARLTKQQTFKKKPLIFLYKTPEGPVYSIPEEGCLMHDSDEMCDWYGIDGCRY